MDRALDEMNVEPDHWRVLLGLDRYARRFSELDQCHVHGRHPPLSTINASRPWLCKSPLISSLDLLPLFCLFGLLLLALTTKMSCCGGNCGCGADCQCGDGCGGCKMYPDFSSAEASTTAETLIMEVAPQKGYFAEGSEMGVASEYGCKCGAYCTCDPCTCK